MGKVVFLQACVILFTVGYATSQCHGNLDLPQIRHTLPHIWILRDTVNKLVVRLLLEYILV